VAKVLGFPVRLAVLLALLLGAACSSSAPSSPASPSLGEADTAPASSPVAGSPNPSVLGSFPLASTKCSDWNSRMSSSQQQEFTDAFFSSLSAQDLQSFKGGYEGSTPPPRATATGEALKAEFQKFIGAVCGQNASANLQEAVLGTARTEH
jgi:hypothetical protein